MNTKKTTADRFETLDLDTLDQASGGVTLVSSLRGLDVAGTGYDRIDEYDNGATTYCQADNCWTELPYGYFDDRGGNGWW